METVTGTPVPIFNPNEPLPDDRRREWVRLGAGRVCVWEMTAADATMVMERCRRPVVAEGQPVIDHGQAMVWQILMGCYDGDQLGAKRIFGMEHAGVIQQLRHNDWNRLVEAIDRVNSTSDAEEARLTNFTPADTAATCAT